MIKLKNNNVKGNFRNKLLWSFVYTALTSFTVFLVVGLWNRFVLNPTVTSLESSVHPVTKVPYPGISFCNMNKISKRRAHQLADYIVDHTGENYTDVMKSIKFLGQLYDSNYDKNYKTQIDNFQEILDKLQLKIITLMRTLITPCEDLLKVCHWKGVRVNCSDIFYMRLTFEGYCCAFNYVKNTSEWRMRRDKIRGPESGEPSVQSGLSVLVNNDPEDYYYTIVPSAGLNVHVFIPTDYPDKSSGNLIENIADIGTENFFEVVPTTVAAVPDVMNYPVDKRNCLFQVEQLTQFGVYSQSDCFVDCRIKSMMTLCECIPFTIPLSDDRTVCTLRDLPCLDKYKRKWISLAPDARGEITLTEQEDALFCPQTCYPSCEATLYDVSATSVPFYKFDNTTSIHIYYRERFHNLFKQDVVHYWFEILSNYGGIFGLIIGLSGISLMEILVQCVKFVKMKL